MNATFDRRIDAADIAEAAAALSIGLSPEEHETFGALGAALADVMASVDGLPQAGPVRIDARRAQRPCDHRPEDPLNAVVRWCAVKSTGSGGALNGVRLAVKDCIAVADVPMTAGSMILDDFVPSVDATVVSRALAAGAEIVAITNMDDLAMCAGGDSGAHGPTVCPFDAARSAGGSSSGSAAALHYEGVDMGLGTDTGGSVRVPAAWCGVVGFKPTHGLVPLTGVLAIDRLFDHVGTLTRTVEDAARLLGVISGPDGFDPMQDGSVAAPDFAAALAAGVSLQGRRIAMVAEGFDGSLGVEPAVRDAVLAAARRLEAAGAQVIEMSLPEHLAASAVMFSMLAEGLAGTLATGGNGYQLDGAYWPDLALALRAGLKRNVDHLSPQVKLALLAGTIMRRRAAGASYARAANARRGLVDGYNRALVGVDALLLPTTPGLPLQLADELPLAERITRSWGPLTNTSATNITGHPAVSLPLAVANGLPVGVMLVGARHGDAELLALADAIESTIGWTHP
jgi:amidase